MNALFTANTVEGHQGTIEAINIDEVRSIIGSYRYDDTKMNLTTSLRRLDRVSDRCSLLAEFDQRRCAIKKLGLGFIRLTVLFVANLCFAPATHAGEFMLICKWDDTNELQAIRVVGGR